MLWPSSDGKACHPDRDAHHGRGSAKRDLADLRAEVRTWMLLQTLAILAGVAAIVKL